MMQMDYNLTGLSALAAVVAGGSDMDGGALKSVVVYTKDGERNLKELGK